MDHLLHSLLRLQAALSGSRHRPRGSRRADRRDDRGDVPGWVMVTVMTAGLVAVLTTVAGPQLQQMLTNALNSVK